MIRAWGQVCGNLGRTRGSGEFLTFLSQRENENEQRKLPERQENDGWVRKGRRFIFVSSGYHCLT